MIGRKATLTMANLVAGSLLGLIAAKLIAVYFGAKIFGQVTFALGALGTLYFLTDLGMGQAHVKRVSEGRDPGDCFATFAVFKVVSTGLFVLVALGALAFYTFVLGRTIVDTSVPVILIILVYYMAKSLQDIGQSSFDARLETARSQVASLTDTLVRVGLTVVFALLVAALLRNAGPLLGRLDPGNPVYAWMAAHPAELLAIATAAGGIAAAIVAIVMLRRSFERGRFRMELLKDYASFALPLFITGAIGIISTNIDSTSLGLFRGDVEAGLFNAVKRLPLVLGGIGTGIGILLFPSISSMAAQGDTAGVHRRMDGALRYLSMLLVPMVAFGAVFAPELIHIFLSDEFVEGAFPMALLCGYILLITLGNPHANMLMGMNRPEVAARVSIVTAVTLIALDLLLIPDDIKALGIRLGGMGVTGAAIATFVSGAVYYGSLRFATWRLAKYRERSQTLRHLGAAALMSLALLAMDQMVVPFTRWFELPLYMMVGGLVYAAGLVVLRAFTREDYAFVKDSLHPGEMLRYMREELRQKRR